MAIPPLPTDEVIDHYLHGLMSPEDSAAVEAAERAEPAWSAAMAAGRRRLAALRAALPAIEPHRELTMQTVQRVLGAEARRHRGRVRGWIGVVTGFALAASLLLAMQHIVANTSPPYFNLQVLGQNTMIADSPASLRVHVSDSRTGQPQAGVLVGVGIVPANDNRVVELARLTTDQAGTVTPNFRVPDWVTGNYQLTVWADTVDATDTADYLGEQVKITRPVRLMLSTDKPVYQPGQTIHARGLALRRPDLMPEANQPSTFTLTDTKGNTLYKQVRPTSAFGITSIDCPLAAELAEGMYTLTCTVGSVSSATPIDVRRYVLPKFAVDIRFDRQHYRPGAIVGCTVTGRYFFGQPVAGGTLQTEVRLDEPGQPVVDKRTQTLGPDGQVRFEFKLPDRLAGRPQDDGAARFTLAAALKDTAGQESGKSVSRLVTAEDLHIEAIPEAGPMIPELDNRLYILVTTPDGDPVRAEVVVRYGEKTLEIASNDLGAAVLDVKPDPGASQFAIAARAADGRTGKRSVAAGVDLSGDFLIRTDKAVYSAGDTMTVSVLGNGIQPVFLDIIRDGQTIRTETINLADGRGGMAIDLPAEMSGTIQLCAYRIVGDALPRRKLRTIVVKPPEGLQIALAADKPEYRPGETAKLRFTVTDAQGRPAPGAISLAAVDEAVYAVLQQRPGLEQVFYLLEQELLKPVATLYPWSPFAPLPAQDRELFELALFASTAREIGTGGAPGADLASPHSLVLSSLPAKIRAHAAMKDSQLARIQQLWHALAIAAGIVGYIAVCQWLGTLRVVMATALLAGLGLANVYFLGGRAGNTFFGVGSVLAPADKAARLMAGEEGPRTEAKSEAGDAPLRVRDRFPETLLWKPELITDDQGRAEIDVALADSITTWRLAASAVTADGRLGAMQGGIRVFQPFFVDLDLPVALTRGDKVSVPVVVSNFLDQPQSVTVTLADLSWADRDGPASETLELPPRAVRSVKFPLTVKKVGSHTLEVTARAQGVADAVRRTFQVIPDGRVVEVVQSGNLDRPAKMELTLPADAIEGSPSLHLRLYPSTFSQLLEGLDAIFKMPYGCFEQTSSTTYPNIIALDYMKRTGLVRPEIEAKARQYITLGYQRLVGFEVPGGGFDWFGRGPADVTLTAYGLMEFTDMARVHDVDPALLRRTRAWLLRQRQADGTWPAGKFHAGAGSALAATAYVARAVFDGQDDLQAGLTRDALLRQPAESIGDPFTLAQVVDALRATRADPAMIQPYLDRLLFMKRSSDDGKLIWWEQPRGSRTCFYGSGRSADIEATAMTAQILVRLGQHPAVAKAALHWLITQKDPAGTWHSTQGTVLTLQAITMASTGKLSGDRERTFLIKFGESEQRITVPRDQAEVVQRVDLSPLWKTGASSLLIEETSATGSGWQVVASHNVPGKAPAPKPPLLDVTLTYDRTQTIVGEVVKARTSLRNTGPAVAPMVMLDLPIPGGFAIDPAEFDAQVASGRIARYQVNPRQVIVYLTSLAPEQSWELSYSLRATMPVEVSAAAARAYEYYNPDRQVSGGATRLVATER